MKKYIISVTDEGEGVRRREVICCGESGNDLLWSYASLHLNTEAGSVKILFTAGKCQVVFF